jgi:hypothetical protein
MLDRLLHEAGCSAVNWLFFHMSGDFKLYLSPILGASVKPNNWLVRIALCSFYTVKYEMVISEYHCFLSYRDNVSE